MSKTNPQAGLKGKRQKAKGKNMLEKAKSKSMLGIRKGKFKTRVLIFAFCLFIFAFASACRYDMQDQPRYEPYAQSDFFSDEKAMREPPEGTVARGQLRENKAFWTGKKENADPNIQVETTIDASGNTLVSSFPNDVTEFPVPITKELIDRGQERYNIYCIVCHGAVGNGDGMIVRRGYPQPPTYHDDRLRNAPVGHFFDVMTNGWGKMNSYAAQIPAADRWAIVAYIRALQVAQNPDRNTTMTSNTNSQGANSSNRTNANSSTPISQMNTNANSNANTGGANR